MKKQLSTRDYPISLSFDEYAQAGAGKYSVIGDDDEKSVITRGLFNCIGVAVIASGENGVFRGIAHINNDMGGAPWKRC